jgi:hypothetical protein
MLAVKERFLCLWCQLSNTFHPVTENMAYAFRIAA